MTNSTPSPGAAQAPRDPALVLMGSALLGTAAWQPVADRLASLGWDVFLAPEPSAPAPLTVANAVDAYRDAVPPGRPVVLVPHSNAGNYVPSIVTTRNVVGVVFVDAVTPVDAGSQPLGMPEQVAALEPLADEDGMLPPWTKWFADEDVDPLFPDAATRSRIEALQPRLPLSYFHDRIAVEVGWAAVPAGYLAFGDTYADERDRARRNGWPVVTLEGGHLHMLVDPERVAAEISSLAQF